LIADQVDAALIERNWDDLRRLAKSIRNGKVSSFAVGRQTGSLPARVLVQISDWEPVGRVYLVDQE
jgi:hypothetical protein